MTTAHAECRIMYIKCNVKEDCSAMRKLAIAAFSFSAAVFAALYLMGEGKSLFWAGILVVAGLFALLLKGSRRTAVMLTVFAAAVGMLWVFAYQKIVYAPAAGLDGETMEISAMVQDFPSMTDYGSRVPVKLTAPSGKKIKAELFIFDNSGDELIPGDEITVEASLALTDETYSTYMTQGSFLSAFAREKVEKISSGIGEKHCFLHRYLAKGLRDKITEIFPESVSHFIMALLTGDKTELNEDTVLSSALRISGISHVVAVSGMHLAFIVGFVMSAVRRKRAASLAAIPVILVFAAMVGFPPSIVRAAVMQIMLLIAPLVRREPDPVTSLAFALGLILDVNPYAAKSVSLQLSFGAAMGMILVTAPMRDGIYSRLRRKKLMKKPAIGSVMRFVADTFCTTVGAMVLTIPISAIHFGSISLIAPVTNLLVLWSVSLAFGGAFIACILGFIWTPLGTAAAFIAALPARYVIWVSKGLAKMSLASASVSSVPVMICIVLIYVIAILFIVFKAKARQLIVPGAAAAVIFCGALILSVTPYDTGSLAATAVSVGQGQSILLTSGGYTAMVDCGSGSGENAGRIASSYLAGKGIDRIDTLIFTHLHDDHANGFTALAENIDIGAILMPEPQEGDEELRGEIIALAEYREIDVIYVTEDISVTLGDMTADIYAPLGYGDENENGLIVLFKQEAFDVLITGDAPAYVEKRLVEEKALPDTEVLIVGHHGSKYSTCEELLSTAKPDTAVISVGENSYGHPTPETLQRLLSRGISVYRTDIDGNITLTSE